MIFLPNKFELYTCILRNTMQTLIIKNGYKSKYLKNLMKIHRAEALFCDNTEPINIKTFTDEILKAVFIKKTENEQGFGFRTSAIGTFLINKKLYTSLLLSLCRKTDRIKVDLLNEKILITASVENFDLKIIKAIGGNHFFERKSKQLYILITAPKTNKTPIDCEKDWEYILNPLSVVNIYLN